MAELGPTLGLVTGAAVVGFLVSLLGTGLLLSAAEGPAAGQATPVPAATASTEPPPTCTERTDTLVERLDELDALIGASELQERLLEGQLAQIGGLPIPWPDDVSAAFTESGLRARIQAADAAVDTAEVLEIDCAEYPCLVAVRTTGPDSTEPGFISSMDADRLRQELDSKGIVSVEQVRLEDEAYGIGIVSIVEETADGETALRRDVRSARILKDLRDGLTGEAP